MADIPYTIADSFWDLRDDAFDHPRRWPGVDPVDVFQCMAEAVEAAESSGEPIDWRRVTQRVITWRADQEIAD
jgi:hypothetical protein